MTLEEITRWLYLRTSEGIRWGLERTEAMLAGVGDPHRHFRSLHIGGTNGKGSVAACCEGALRASGAAGRTGLYTSPHLVSFTERIRIDGAPAPDELIVRAAERLQPAIEQTGASFFEATTAIAFLCFADAGVETAVVEVGLGGRLDSTNVIHPLATAVTNVALDHTEYLGDTLPEIAREKAGIFKPGVPALTGEEDPAVLGVLRESARSAGTPLVALDEVARVEWSKQTGSGSDVGLRSSRWGERTLQVPLRGAHQVRNAVLAAELLGMLPEAIRPDWGSIASGIAGVRWPARLQVERVRGTTWVFDVAHNAAGAAALAASLDTLDLPRPWVLVVGVLADKRWQEMLPPLLARADGAIFTLPPSAPASRRWDPRAAGEWAATRDVPVRVVPEFSAALDRATTLAPHGTVIVTGSFHTVGDAMLELGIPIP